MARRKKKKSKGQMHKGTSLTNFSIDELIERGRNSLKQEKFQDAIACFKHLLKREERVEFLQGLQNAYKGRIISLANKSMLKEAMALLDILIQRFPDTSFNPLQLKLLLQADHYAEAVKLYNQCHSQLSQEQKKQLETLFGILLLTCNDVKLSDFDADSAIVRIYPKALAAIEIFSSEQANNLEDLLKQIPIRSPYRDLRTLLTGLHHFLIDEVKGKEILQKITADSPYHYSAAKFSNTTISSKSVLTTLANTPKSDHPKLPELHGVPGSHIRILEELAVSDGKPKQLYQIVHRNERYFGKEKAFQLYRNILPYCRDHALEILQRTKAFSFAEKCRLCALSAEKDDAPPFAVAFWSDYLETIKHKDTTRYREIAMIIRRQATLMERDPYEYSSQEIIDTLLKSLEYDPSHALTWITAAKYAKQYQGTKQQYAILQNAVQKLPGDVSILLAAMRACSNRNAHKKAAGLAKKVLAVDPINTEALDFLVASHLEHARKLASQKKWNLAEKELLAANTRVRSVQLKGRSQICLGMILLHQKNDSGLQHIELGRQENPYPLFSHILVALEARLYGVTQKRVKEFDNLLKRYVKTAEITDPREFHSLISWTLDFEMKHWHLWKQICQVMKEYFSKALSLDFSLDEGLSFCRVLERIDLPVVLAKCATMLKKKHPDVLQFRVWSLVATAWKQNRTMTSAEDDELEVLLDDLTEKEEFDFIDHIANIIDKRDLEFPLYFDHEDIEEDEHFIDFGPFGPPKTMPKQQKTKSPKPAKFSGKQLNLFDDQS